MATIPWLSEVLRAEGVEVVEEGDWLGHGRPGSFDPFGVLWHHTAATSSADNPHPALQTCINGRPDLPGPLCQALVDYHGVFHVISGGRANHAGESCGSGPIPSGDGNAMLIGWEIDYNGTSQAMTDAQYQASVKATAAVLRHLGRDATHVRGHKETSCTGKIDPAHVDLNTTRADVQKHIDNPNPEQEIPDMFVISAPNRGIAVVGPGYYRSLKDDEEVHAATALVGKNNVREGNERQFDLWKHIASSGKVAEHA